MKARGRVFDAKACIEAARSGRLSGRELRNAIKLAQEFGNRIAAEELNRYLVSPWSFFGDDAPPEIRARVAQGISALIARGEPLSRTRQMLKKHGVIETLNRIARYPNATKNFETLCAAGLMNLTAEAIVLDFPDRFSPAAVAVARERLRRWKSKTEDDGRVRETGA